MAPSTLKAMAQRNLIRNLSGLTEVGDVPYELVRPALKKIEDAQQLRKIEIASPHISESDGECWERLIKRDVGDWQTKMVRPSNPSSWWKVYRKLFREEKERQEAALKGLSDKMSTIDREKEENKANLLDVTVKQRFKQSIMVDGVFNPKAGRYGLEGAPSVRQAQKTGKGIVSALAKSSSEQARMRRMGTSWDAKPRVEQRMWKGAVKGAPRITPNRQRSMAERTAEIALKRAFEEDAQLKEERAAKKRSRSPPDTPPPAIVTPAGMIPPSASLTDANLSARAYPSRAPLPTPPNTQSSQATASLLSTSRGQTQLSPPRTSSPAVPAHNVERLGPGAGIKRTASPAMANPIPQKRAKPAVSLFIPKKVKR